MSCVSPILVRSGNGVVLASCGRCMSCCIARRSALEFLCNKELQEVYKRGLGASMLTLTYNDLHLPVKDGHMTLVKSDLQKYLKRVRYYASLDNIPYFKYIGCGEYGGQTKRPHYHLVFLGLSDFLAKKYTYKAWLFGFPQIGALRSGGIRYVTKYITKSRSDRELEKVYDTFGVEKPFIVRSQKIARDYLNEHALEISNSGYTFKSHGKVRLFPKPVRDYVEKITGVSQREAVMQYMNNINTHGLSLDDYLAEKTYYNEMEQQALSRLHLTPYYTFDKMRLPLSLRDTTNVDFKSLAVEASFDDSVPF